MLLSHLNRLYVSSILLISASPIKAAPTTAPTTNSLPRALQQAAPSCAQSCIRTSLDERFPIACSGQESIDCLCSRYSNMGESLGEVALGCIYLSCPTSEQQTSLDSAYGVCLGQTDAVMPTKTALTYVVTSAPRTISTSVMTSAPTIAPSITSTLQTQTSSTQSVIVDSISTFASATSSASTTPAPAVATEDPPTMTPAQIAGLSVAAVAAFILAIGLMALSVCLRRRREKKDFQDPDEKGQSQRQKKQSARFSHYVPLSGTPESSKQFPMPPPQFPRPPSLALRKEDNSNVQTARPVQRLGVGTSRNSSESSLPLDQIGLAISAELDGKPLAPKQGLKDVKTQQPPIANKSQLNAPFRPTSTMTQDTVFEEDDIPARRRSSTLLPTPPVPIPPIRALQPSRTQRSSATRQPGRRSELFLDIPVRHERSQPRRIITANMPSTGSPQPPQPTTRPRLAPAFHMSSNTITSYKSEATTASSRDASNSGDIIDYYFSSPPSRSGTPKANPAPISHSKAAQPKPKKSLSSTLSRATSRTSTDLRDSVSSQTSFETVDHNDPTPDDEDEDKQLSDNSARNSKDTKQLSPVAESPISHLRYPKVPRTANQLVPRSPKSPQQAQWKSPQGRAVTDPSTLLSKRNNALPPLLLESRKRLNSPARDPFTSPPRVISPPRVTSPPPRKPRAHNRSISDTSPPSFGSPPLSHTARKSRVQSGNWGQSPLMYAVEEVKPKPLNVRRKRDEMSELNIGRDVDVDFDREGLKSPVWVPKLTPRKRGEDMFLEVGWGDRS